MIEFTPKNWQNVPSASTPISAAALEDLETRVTDNAQANVAVIGEVLDVDTTGATDEASAIQTAQDNLESQGGGRLLLPNTGTGGSIQIGSLVTFGHAVNVVGQGKRETRIVCTAGTAGFWFVGSGDAGYSGSTNRGGRSGGFAVNGNNSATAVMTVRGTNRVFEDVRLETPADNGKALYIDQAQNTLWLGLEAEDASHSGSRTVRGIVFDGGASGHNFVSTSLNEFTDGHVVFDASYDAPAALGIDYSNDVTFFGNMIERTDTGNPIIKILSGRNIRFIGGRISGNGFTVGAEYDLVYADNSAARSFTSIGSGGAVTEEIAFKGIGFTGETNGGTKYANVFRAASGVENWPKLFDVSSDCTYANCKYLARVDPATAVVYAPNQNDAATGGLSSGWSNPSGSGKVNARILGSSATLSAKSTVNYYEVSGSTTITSISATYAGHEITILLTSTAQITDGSNLKIAGNFTGSGDRTIKLVCNGTNWYELTRSTN